MRNWKPILFLVFYLTGGFFYSASGQSVLWKAEKNGKCAYLLGTFHIPVTEFPAIKKQIDSLIPKMNLVLLELNPKDVGSLALIQYFAADSTYSLKDLVGEKKYKTIARYFEKEFHTQVEQFQSFQPAFLMSLVVSKIALKNQSADLAMDKYIGRVASEKAKKVVGLEKPEEQVKALTTLSYKEQGELLYRAVRKAHKGEKELNQMKRYYLRGKLDYLLRLSDREWKDFPAYKKALIHDRNHRFVERALPYLEEGDVLLAVGALHYPGPDGILTLLREAGFQITPLPIQ